MKTWKWGEIKERTNLENSRSGFTSLPGIPSQENVDPGVPRGTVTLAWCHTVLLVGPAPPETTMSSPTLEASPAVTQLTDGGQV